MDGPRLWLAWRVAIVVVAITMAVDILLLIQPDLVGWWTVAATGILVIIEVALLVRTRPRPFAQPSSRFPRHDRVNATRALRRGQPVTPLDLQTVAADMVRRQWWAFPLQCLLWSAVVLSWTFQSLVGIGETMHLAGGLILVALAVGLGLQHRSMRRIDALPHISSAPAEQGRLAEQ